MSTDSSHLTLEELTAGASGVTPPSQLHLAGCSACQAETRRWDAAESGVRLLVADCQPTAGLIDSVLAAIEAEAVQPLSPGGQATSRSVRVRSVRGQALLASAAALVLLAAGGYGLASALSPGHRSTGAGLSPSASAGNTTGNSPGTTTAGLTATGCSGASSELAAGTLAQVNGTGLVLTTTSGSTLRVTTSSATEITREVTGSRADITNGGQVIVRGTTSGTQLAAASVVIGSGAAPSLPSLPSGSLGNVLLRSGFANGTVTGAGSGGFTVVEQDGTRVQATTSSSTTVSRLADATVEQLKTGEFTTVVGMAVSGGMLTATTVEQGSASVGDVQVSPPQSLPTGLPAALPTDLPTSLPSGSGPGSIFHGLGCSSTAIATAAFLTHSPTS